MKQIKRKWESDERKQNCEINYNGGKNKNDVDWEINIRRKKAGQERKSQAPRQRKWRKVIKVMKSGARRGKKEKEKIY